MKPSFYVLGIGMALTFFSAYSQSVDVLLQPGKPRSSAWFADYTQEVTGRIQLLNRSLVMNVEGRSLKKGFSLEPNTSNSVGISVVHKWLGVSVSVPLPERESLTSKRGNTQALDIQAYGFTRRFLINGYFQRYTGMFIRAPKPDEQPLETTELFIKRPDVRMLSTGVLARYVFNSARLSQRAAYVGSEVQLRSAGSLVVVPSINWLSVSADSSLVGDDFFKPGLRKDNLSTGNFLNIGLGTGYMFTLVFLKKCYFSMNLTGGIAYQHQQIFADGSSSILDELSTTWNFSTAVGITGRRLFAGIMAFNNSYNHRFQNLSYISSTLEARLFLGYRLGLSKPLLPDNPFKWHRN